MTYLGAHKAEQTEFYTRVCSSPSAPTRVQISLNADFLIHSNSHFSAYFAKYPLRPPYDALCLWFDRIVFRK
jgi:hypothetical protein